MIEDAKSLARIGVDVEDSDFLSGSRSSTGLSYFFTNAEFAGSRNVCTLRSSSRSFSMPSKVPL